MVSFRETANIFKVLSVETRIRIIEMLKVHPLCVNAIAHKLDITAAAASQHLRIMRNAGIVIAEKKGYFVHYELNANKLNQWQKIAEELLS